MKTKNRDKNVKNGRKEKGKSIVNIGYVRLGLTKNGFTMSMQAGTYLCIVLRNAVIFVDIILLFGQSCYSSKYASGKLEKKLDLCVL